MLQPTTPPPMMTMLAVLGWSIGLGCLRHAGGGYGLDPLTLPSPPLGERDEKRPRDRSGGHGSDRPGHAGAFEEGVVDAARGVGVADQVELGDLAGEVVEEGVVGFAAEGQDHGVGGQGGFGAREGVPGANGAGEHLDGHGHGCEDDALGAEAVVTWGRPTPGIWGTRGVEPVATMTDSGLSFSTSATSVGVFRRISTPALRTWPIS